MFARLSRITVPAYAPYAVLIGAVFLAYSNVYHNDFVFDDQALIVHNTFLRQWSHLPDLLKGKTSEGGRAFYRPLPMVIYFLMYQAFGLSTVAFHALNVVLQAVNAGLVYRLGSRLGLQLRASFAAALLWAVHPLWTEVVACAGGTSDPLSCLFCLGGILVLLPDFAPRKFWLAGLFLILALGSKESAIVFPALATFTLFLVSKERLCAASYLRTWPLWLLAAVYLIARLCTDMRQLSFHDPQDMLFGQIYEHNFVNRILTCLATLPVYFSLMIWPVCLHMERSFPVFTSLWSWQVLAGVVMVAGVLLQLILGKGRRGLALSWGFLWLAAAQSPNTGIIKPLYALISEHWIYLPTVGLFLGVAQTVAVWIDDRKSTKVSAIVAILVVLAALSLGTRTYLQNKVWHDTVSLFEHILQCGSNSGAAHNILGRFYFKQGDYEKAAAHFRAEIAHPAPIPISMTSSAHIRLAFIYLGVRPDENGVISPEAFTGALPLAPHLPEATEELKKALEIAPAGDADAIWASQLLSMINAYHIVSGR